MTCFTLAMQCPCTWVIGVYCQMYCKPTHYMVNVGCSLHPYVAIGNYSLAHTLPHAGSQNFHWSIPKAYIVALGKGLGLQAFAREVYTQVSVY